MSGFRFVDLFCGIGGFHTGLAALGGECVLASDNNPKCREVYEHLYGDDQIFVEDVRAITDVPDHDVLCAGFPCQPFSTAGRNKGEADTRGTLFHDILRIAELANPSYILLENVPNLCSVKHQDTWLTIVRSLRELGYGIDEKPLIFNPRMYPEEAGGAPQNRPRVFLAASRLPDKWDVMRRIHKLASRAFPQKWRIKEWLDDENAGREASDDYERGLKMWEEYIQKHGIKRVMRAEFEGVPMSRSCIDWAAENKTLTLRDKIIQMRIDRMRVKPATYMPALVVCNTHCFLGPDITGGDRFRKLSVPEASRLQGISDRAHTDGITSVSQAIKQLGNAVNSGMVKMIAQEMMI